MRDPSPPFHTERSAHNLVDSDGCCIVSDSSQWKSHGFVLERNLART